MCASHACARGSLSLSLSLSLSADPDPDPDLNLSRYLPDGNRRRLPRVAGEAASSNARSTPLQPLSEDDAWLAAERRRVGGDVGRDAGLPARMRHATSAAVRDAHIVLFVLEASEGSIEGLR